MKGVFQVGRGARTPRAPPRYLRFALLPTLLLDCATVQAFLLMLITVDIHDEL